MRHYLTSVNFSKPQHCHRLCRHILKLWHHPSLSLTSFHCPHWLQDEIEASLAGSQDRSWTGFYVTVWISVSSTYSPSYHLLPKFQLYQTALRSLTESARIWSTFVLSYTDATFAWNGPIPITPLPLYNSLEISSGEAPSDHCLIVGFCCQPPVHYHIYLHFYLHYFTAMFLPHACLHPPHYMVVSRSTWIRFYSSWSPTIKPSLL